MVPLPGQNNIPINPRWMESRIRSPGKLTLDEYAIGRAKENTKEFMGKR